MNDKVEEVIAPGAIERAILIYKQFKVRDQAVLQQARKILTRHIYAMVDVGECDQHRLTVGGLVRLMATERDHEIKGGCDATLSHRRTQGVRGR